MSVARCLEINARLRAAGIIVHEYPGWQSRGNGQTSAYEGCDNHHTATAYGKALPGTSIGNLLVNGRSDLPGPLANYAGNDDGSLTVIAAHPANHAGASGGYNTAPLPVTLTFNKHVLGLEIVYPGTAPMTAAQYKTATTWAKIVTDVVGYGDINRAKAHAETSVTGKWDPGYAASLTIDMNRFRADALAVLQQPAPPKEVDMSRHIELERGAGPHFVTYKLEAGDKSVVVKNAWVSLTSGFDGLTDVEVIFPKGGGVYLPALSGDVMKFGDLIADEDLWWQVPYGAISVSLLYTCKSERSRPALEILYEPK